MKKLFDYANEYLKKIDMTDMALIKFCLIAIGILIGIHIPAKNKKKAGIIALIVFTLTFLPVMMKFLGVIPDPKKKSVRIM